MDDFSICIVFHNDLHRLRAALAAICEASREFLRMFPQANLEIILVDNNSEEIHKTDIFSVLEEPLGFSLLVAHTQSNNMALARNLALRTAQYENLIFIDADCHPTPNWLISYHQLKSKHFKENTVAIAGENTPPHEDIWLYNYIRLLKKYPALHLRSPQLLASNPKPHVVRHAPTCNILYKRSALLEIDGFNNSFITAGEDLEINSRLISIGQEILFSSEPQVFHHDPPEFLNWLKKVLKYGKVQPQVLSLYPSHVDRERWLPILLLATILGATIALPLSWLFFIFLVALSALAVLGLLRGAGASAIPWAAFVLSTIATYCLGYVVGAIELFGKSRKTIAQQSE